MTTDRIRWGQVLDEARAIVESYDTPVTLRQLYYRLVAAGLLPNVLPAYKRLSALTAEARRNGTFPELADRTRQVHEFQCWASPQDALADAATYYRRDRTEGQSVSETGIPDALGRETSGIAGNVGVAPATPRAMAGRRRARRRRRRVR